jgi:hypothetical protein
MYLARPAFALDPKAFGRGRRREPPIEAAVPSKISADLKLFATTFFAGFLFVSILIG